MAKGKTTKVGELAVDTLWQTQGDLDTFLRWQEIRRDKERLKRVKALAKEKLQDYAAAAGGLAADDNDGDE